MINRYKKKIGSVQQIVDYKNRVFFFVHSSVGASQIFYIFVIIEKKNHKNRWKPAPKTKLVRKKKEICAFNINFLSLKHIEKKFYISILKSIGWTMTLQHFNEPTYSIFTQHTVHCTTVYAYTHVKHWNEKQRIINWNKFMYSAFYSNISNPE